ncbi:MAG: C-type lectin domain-containing protein [Kofleriaceae bacterium]
MVRTAGVWAWLALAGCGRLGFEEGAPRPDAGPDAAPPDGPPCPAEYAIVTGVAGRYSGLLPARNWPDARDACAAVGAQLFAPTSDLSWQAVSTHAFGGPPNATIWAGIHDLDVEGSWQTLSGDAATYLPWHPGEPNDSGDEDCIEVFPKGTFNDQKCVAILNPYVCACP